MNGAKLYHGRYVACRSGVTAGAALILTLACIVILTGLVLLFLTHSLLETQVSVASADQTAASLFARGSVDSVIGELKQEIAAGSAAPFIPAGSDLRDPNTVFLPTTNQTMVPYRMDSAAPANVLKRSSYNEPFYAGSFYNTTAWPAPQWAVNLSSTNTAYIGSGGRFVSTARWNEPLLMPTTNIAGSGATGTWPATSFIPPDWIYVTRTAGPATTFSSALIPNTVSGALNTNCVVGRYAYVVYDEGGLLDANAAGYPSVALDGTSITQPMMRHKISEACADLTQIGLNASDITNLVAWRNPNNDATATTYTNYVYSAATNAFLTPAPGERIFTSRQQLIDFLTQNVAQSPTDIERMQAALPYLTTFSRELNAPSWYPQTNMTASGYNYFSIATNTPASATNAFAPLERANTMYTNVSGLVCSANQPAALSRFPLSRLAWITLNGSLLPNVTAAQIQESFGLVWDSANTAWIYAGPTGSTVQGSIAQLSTIHGREPNFFEMLKAGILSGSVNIVPQPVFITFPNPGDVESRCGTNTGASTSPNSLEIPIPDEQTMQIGLNMIDQASTNALPSRVEFGANAGTSPNNGEDQALYGSKNLPLIYKMVNAFYHPTTTQADTPDGNTQAYFSAWAEPVFWSPYLSAVTNTAPLQIRIRADSTNAGSGYNQFFSDTYNETTDDRIGSPPLPCGGPGTSTVAYTGTSGATIELDAANASTLQIATINPILLASLLTSGAVANPPTINDIRALSPPTWTGPGCPANADLYTEPGGPTYDGFWMGLALAPIQTTDSHHSTATPLGPFNATRFAHDNNTAASRVNHQFVLEANYGTRFLEIQRMEFKYFAQSPVQVQEADLFTVPNRQLDWFTFDDPRTGRFPFTFMNPTSYNVHNLVNAVTAADTSQLTDTLFPDSTDPFTGYILNTPAANGTSINITPSVNLSPTATNPGQDIFRFADNSSTSSANSSPWYQDADGAQRLGDAWWSSNTSNTLPMRIDAGTAQYRPVILNRPFASVGELGYVYRDMPWRSLNFSSTNSPDAGLLDFFCVNDGYAGNTNYPSLPVVGGVVNLNTRNPQVLQALLSGADRAQLYPGTSSSSPVGYDINATDATNIASTITGMTASLPLLNKSELATRIAPNDPTVLAVTSRALQVQSTYDTNIKERREAIVRALASAGQVRTWNLLIDVVAQTGHLPPGASGFNNFTVTAEQRYWAHVAIDRYTGQVVSIQLEPVSE
jgi:hypothetical protein